MKNTIKVKCLFIWIFLLLSIKGYSQSMVIIKEHYKAINAHDIKTIASEYAADAQLFPPDWEGAEKHTEGATGVFTRYFKSTPDLAYSYEYHQCQ